MLETTAHVCSCWLEFCPIQKSSATLSMRAQERGHAVVVLKLPVIVAMCKVQDARTALTLVPKAYGEDYKGVEEAPPPQSSFPPFVALSSVILTKRPVLRIHGRFKIHPKKKLQFRALGRPARLRWAEEEAKSAS